MVENNTQDQYLKKLYKLREEVKYLILGELGETRKHYEDLLHKVNLKIEEVKTQ